MFFWFFFVAFRYTCEMVKQTPPFFPKRENAWCTRREKQAMPFVTKIVTELSQGGFMEYQLDLPETNILLMAEILHQLVWRISHYLQGFIHSRWCRISSINSSTCKEAFSKETHLPTPVLRLCVKMTSRGGHLFVISKDGTWKLEYEFPQNEVYWFPICGNYM